MSDFTQVFFDDFNGGGLDRSAWHTVYSGRYGNGMFEWRGDQLEVGGGKLTVATEREGGSWVSGGVSTIPDGQTYGSYEFRARMDPGQGTAAAVLLWPSDNRWTDEVDILETNRPDRQGFAFSNHGQPNETVYVGTDVSRWHTYRLDWTPGELKLFVDGQQQARLTHDVPDQKMSFGMQGMVMGPGDGWFGGAPDGSTPSRVALEVDWVKISAWTPGQGGASASAAAASWSPELARQGAPPSVAGALADWIDDALAYLAKDGTWEGSWRNQVAAGQITVEDVAAHLMAGRGSFDPWA